MTEKEKIVEVLKWHNGEGLKVGQIIGVHFFPPCFIGYKASARLSELVREGRIEIKKHPTDKKFSVYSIKY